jgi:hypothetical protein
MKLCAQNQQKPSTSMLYFLGSRICGVRAPRKTRAQAAYQSQLCRRDFGRLYAAANLRDLVQHALIEGAR